MYTEVKDECLFECLFERLYMSAANSRDILLWPLIYYSSHPSCTLLRGLSACQDPEDPSHGATVKRRRGIETCPTATRTSHVPPPCFAKMKRHASPINSGRERRRQDPVSCSLCRSKKLKCSREQPCSNCTSRGVTCDFSPARPSSLQVDAGGHSDR